MDKEIVNILSSYGCKYMADDYKEMIEEIIAFVKKREEAINYAHSSTQLKEKEAISFEDWLDMNNYTQIKDAVFKDENGKKFKQTTLRIEYYNNTNL